MEKITPFAGCRACAKSVTRESFFVPIVKVAVLALAWSSFAYAGGPAITLTPANASGIYKPGDKAVWRVEVRDDAEHVLKNAKYVLKQGGEKVIAQGDLSFNGEPITIEASLNLNPAVGAYA